MSINVSQLATYSDQDLLTIYRWALANGAAGQTREIAGRSMSFPPAGVIMNEIIPALEMRLAAANGGTTAVVQNADHRSGPGPFFGRM
jgi:hypothetical protein